MSNDIIEDLGALLDAERENRRRLESELADLRRQYESAIEQIDVLRTALRIESAERVALREQHDKIATRWLKLEAELGLDEANR